MEKRDECAWCGRPVAGGSVREHKPFCPECHSDYQRELQRPWHACEERIPQYD